MQDVSAPQSPPMHDIVVTLPLSAGFYDLAQLSVGLDYHHNDLVCRMRLESVHDDAQELPSIIEGSVEPFIGRGVYVHGPFSVRFDPDTGVFKVNTLKQAIGLTLRVTLKIRR